MCHVQAEQRQKFDGWAAPHVRDMERLARRLSGDTDADDVVQNALLRAWERWATFDPRRGTARTWLLAIVADQARQWRRRPRPVTAALDTVRGAVAAAEHGDGGDIDLRQAVARLPERQRLAVECHYYIGLTVRETAQVLSCATGTVKATLSAARANLRSQLEEQP